MISVNTIQPHDGQYLHLSMMDVCPPLYSEKLRVRRISVKPLSARSCRVYVGFFNGNEEVVTTDRVIYFRRDELKKSSGIPVWAHVAYEDTGDNVNTDVMHVTLKSQINGKTPEKLVLRVPCSEFLTYRRWYNGVNITMSPWEIHYSRPLMFHLTDLINAPEAFRKIHLPEYTAEQVAELVSSVVKTVHENFQGWENYLAMLRKAKVKQLTAQELARKYRVDKDKCSTAEFIAADED